ncbi:MAG: hypothetical protein HYS87_02370 [Candidatus Colwellbacteria bacterium]|nr:hypothetical protein [Candidatus Colwellbacteria bacterium]
MLLALLLKAGKDGLRTNELASKAGISQSLTTKHLMPLTQTLLVVNYVKKIKGERPIASIYYASTEGEKWFRKLRFLQDGGVLLPLLPEIQKIASRT